MTTQPQPSQPTELAATLLKRIREVELPPYLAAGLIVLSVHEDWSDARLKHERFKAKRAYFFERLGEEEAEVEEKPGPEEIRMLRDGEDEDC